MGETIRVRLTLWYVSLFAALLIAFAGIVTLAELRNEASELDATLRGAARVSGELLEPRDPHEPLSRLVRPAHRELRLRG